MSLSATADPFVPSSAPNVCEMLQPVVLQLVAVAAASNDGLTPHAREKEVMKVRSQSLRQVFPVTNVIFLICFSR